MKKELLNKVLLDIRAWIVLFFFLRLFAINNPPLEVAHNWRQTTVTMSARNFLETEANIFYPRVDFAGEKSGITGMEFPLLNYLIYLVSLVFGYAHWYGRLINLIVSSLGLWFFYQLVKKYFSVPLAFKATFILLFSIWFAYSRKIMPDTFSMSLVFAGLYYGSNYLDREESSKNLFLYFVFTLLGALSKLPSAYLLVLFFPLIVSKKISAKSKLIFAALSSVIVALVSAYYFYWVPYLTSHYGFEHFFMGKGIWQGLKEVVNNAGISLEKFYLDALQFVGFGLFVAGLILGIIKKNRLLLLVFVICTMAFLIVVCKAGATFSHHSYYIIPFAPIMALMAAFALDNIRNPKLLWVLLLILLLEGVLNKLHDFHIKEKNLAITKLEATLDKLGSRNDLILINSGDVPTPMYFAHRKGWIGFNETLANTEAINYFKAKGLKYIVVLKRAFGEDVALSYEKVFESVDFNVYRP